MSSYNGACDRGVCWCIWSCINNERVWSLTFACLLFIIHIILLIQILNSNSFELAISINNTVATYCTNGLFPSFSSTWTELVAPSNVTSLICSSSDPLSIFTVGCGLTASTWVLIIFNVLEVILLVASIVYTILDFIGWIDSKNLSSQEMLWLVQYWGAVFVLVLIQGFIVLAGCKFSRLVSLFIVY